jgi:uncharacterized protein
VSGPGLPEPELDPIERAALLAVARAAVRAAVLNHPPPTLPDLPTRLDEPAGAFVSLHAGSALRGCIGSVTPEGSLAALVARVSAAAATGDPRFLRVHPDELPQLELEISVLSPAVPIPHDRIDPVRHGVSIRLGPRRGVLLPQVAAREGWDRAALLTALCEKAGLPPEAWRDPAAILLAFTVTAIEGPLDPP